MNFYQLDVFAHNAYQGNPLAVFPDAGDLTTDQMQALAREMNLSETTFVTSTTRDSYDVRIFTPSSELPFAGHPTIGTAWLLKEIELVTGDHVVQRSAAGETRVSFSGADVWFDRTGSSEDDLEATKPNIVAEIAAALSIEATDIGFEAREIGRPGRLRPGYGDAGLHQLMVPLRDVETLGRVQPQASLTDVDPMGAYCFAPVKAGAIRSRGFFPGVGVAEDPATGSAAAALGMYLAARIGDIRLEMTQGVEMGRPSTIELDASEGHVRVGGRCRLIFAGELKALP
ncbi:MAG TPA: PhzF family phenazine biosynthesis protein [Actinomycetota bacterium]|nr:PhzF family phenazine biosynthesis protein [Actinomycetota bacterium]